MATIKVQGSVVDAVVGNERIQQKVAMVVAALGADHPKADPVAKTVEYLLDALWQHVEEGLYSEGACLQCGQVISKRVVVAQGRLAPVVRISCPCNRVADVAAQQREERWASAIKAATVQHAVRKASPRR